MSNKNWLFILIILLLIPVLYIAAKSQATKSSLSTDTQPEVTGKAPENRTLAISAQNGQFTPNTISFDSHDNMVLYVDAKDRDYTFSLEEIGLTQTLQQGQTTEISLVGLGVGTHTFTCGTGCQGTITVAVEAD